MKLISITLFVVCILGSQLLFSQNNNHILTYSGDGTAGFVNGSVDSAEYNNSAGICSDGSGNLYIADVSNHVIRKIDVATGQVTTYAGTGTAGYLDGPAASAKFNQPFDVCADDSGNIYVSDFLNQRIRKISAGGIVSTVAGTGQAGYIDGPALAARFNYPRGLCRDNSGNLYVGDSWNHRIRMISPAGEVTTWAGGGTAMGVGSVGGYIDGPDTSARFNVPCGLGIDASGNIYVADAYNHRIRKIDPNRIVSTLAGSGPTGNGQGGFANGYFHNSIFNTPTEVLVFDGNTILVGDTYGNRVRKLDLPDTLVNTYAGDGTAGFTSGEDTAAELNHPRGMTSCNGLAYFIDGLNHAVRVVIPDSVTGIPSGGSMGRISIYPNPASDKIRLISTPGSGPCHVQILDMTANILLNHLLLSRDQEIDISHLNSGFYLLRVEQDQKVSVIPFIKR